MFELFRVGFITFTFLDLIDVLIVTYIFYKIYSVLRGTIASQIFLGLLLIFLLSFGAQILQLKAIGWLLRLITDIWIITFIILFQPEIRRLLVIVARAPFLRFNIKSYEYDTVNIIIDAVYELSQHQHGALIIVIKSSGIRGHSETGKMIGAKVSKELIRAIFYPRSALHDGAIVINNDIIESAAATMPFSAVASIDGEILGMRHRAGLGISEQADVLSIIVSEETGSISVADNGKLYRGISRDVLKKYLENIYRPSKQFHILSRIESIFRKK